MSHEAATARDELARVLAGEEFRHAERLSAILRFLVERALEGRAPAKEYEIGVEVLGRSGRYDPRTDPIVRVEMRQLRLKLTRHYSAAGDPPLRIDVPKGRYQAVFVRGLTHATSKSPPPQEGVNASSQVSRRVLAIGVVVAVGLALFVWVFREHPASIALPPVEPGPSLAVLAFSSVSGDPAQQYFGEGLTEEIVSRLGRVDGLRITGGASSFSFKARGEPPAEVAKQLGVQAVLTGSIRRNGERVRVIATLMNAAGVQYWSGSYDVETAHPVAAQEGIARDIAAALQGRLDPSSGQTFVKRSNNDAAAHDLYVRARRLANSRGTPDLLASVDLFQQAIARDPGYAVAFAGLADAYGVLAFNGEAPLDEAIAKAREAAAHALRIDPTLGEAEAHLASLDAFVDWNWQAADRRFKQAITLAPMHPRIHAWYGQMLLAQSRFSEAVTELRTAQQLDPMTASIGYALGEAYLYANRPDAATTQARRLIAANPTSWSGHNLLARAAICNGRPDDALKALEASRGELWADVLALVATGDLPRARQTLNERSSSLASQQPFALASLYAQAGDQDRALFWLQQAYQRRQVDLAYLAVDPGLASLHARADYRALVAKVGLTVAVEVP
jgi:TolB-like protein/Flp pilus assembly protein TadD